MRAPVALFALFLAATPALAESMDVAPTTLDLTAGQPGLFYITNHGQNDLTVQVQPMDWSQDTKGDTTAPSQKLLVSPQFATIPAGKRQSVRVLARDGGVGEIPHRLLVSQLPDPNNPVNGVRVLLQFSVPVFVGHSDARPALSWSVVTKDGKPALEAHNSGTQTVKLTRLAINGVPQPGSGLYYVLPGSSRTFEGAATSGTVTAHDDRSGSDVKAEIGAH